MNIYRNATVATITALVLLGTVGCAPGSFIRTADGTASGDVLTAAGDTAPAPSTASASCDTSALPLPSWIPPIVSTAAVVCPADVVESLPGQVHDTSHVGTMIAYPLSGPANRETLQPAETMTEAGILSGRYHPATAIQLIVYPDPGAIDTEVSGPAVAVSTVRLDNGLTAWVAQGSNGYGTIRIAWTDSARSYLLMTAVMKTESGTSGASMADMLRMAGSIPASNVPASNRPYRQDT